MLIKRAENFKQLNALPVRDLIQYLRCHTMLSCHRLLIIHLCAKCKNTFIFQKQINGKVFNVL